MSQPEFIVQRHNEWHAVYAGRTADVYMNSATVPGLMKKQMVSGMNKRNEMWQRSCVDWIPFITTPKGRKKEGRTDKRNGLLWHYVGGPPSRRFLCAKPDKGFGLEISMWLEVGRERQLTPDSRSGQSAWEGPAAVREDRSRWVGIPSSFVEILLEIHASISLHMHKGMHSVTESPFLHLN